MWSTGGAIIDATRERRQRGAVIGIALCMIDRESGGSGDLWNENPVLRPAFRMSDCSLRSATETLAAEPRPKRRLLLGPASSGMIWG